MNERGNIAFSLVIVLATVLTIVTLSYSLTNVYIVYKKSTDKLHETYKKDTVIELTKYVLQNEIANSVITAITPENTLLDESSKSQIEMNIKNALTSLGIDNSITVTSTNDILIASVCENVYSNDMDGNEVFEGMHCDYIPNNLGFHLSLEGVAKPLTITLENIYLTVSDDTIIPDLYSSTISTH